MIRGMDLGQNLLENLETLKRVKCNFSMFHFLPFGAIKIVSITIKDLFYSWMKLPPVLLK
jgi:hypothetical protein